MCRVVVQQASSSSLTPLVAALIGALTGGLIAAYIASKGRSEQARADRTARILTLTSSIVGAGRRILRGLENARPPTPLRLAEVPSGVQIAEAEIIRDSVELSALLPSSHLTETALELVEAVTGMVYGHRSPRDSEKPTSEWRLDVLSAQGELDAELAVFAGLSRRDTLKYFKDELPRDRPLP